MKRPRLEYIDWLRGFAVVCMILWHAIDAWTLPVTRVGPLFSTIATVGGFAAPLFLFLAGVSIALAGQSSLTRVAPGPEGPGLRTQRLAASWRLQKRGWQIFLIAHLFRLQSFLFNPLASWSIILKPDILNILGLGLVAAAFCWGRATTLGRKAAWLLAPTIVIMLMTPWARLWEWPAVWLQPHAPRLEAYIRPVPGIGVFSAFPWIAFVFAGALIGSLLAESPTRADDRRSQSRLLGAGLAIVLAGIAGSFVPSFTLSDFWTTSLSLFLIRIGAMTCALTLAWLWLRRPWKRWGSPFVLLGRASLFVYWVHIEIAFGAFSYPIHRELPLGQSVLAFVLLTAAMVWAARIWLNWCGPLLPARLRPAASEITSRNAQVASFAKYSL